MILREPSAPAIVVRKLPTNPSDTSGIQGYYYKLDSPPTANDDGTWETSKPITGITVSGQGSHTLYLWLKDDAENVDYNNYETTTLYYDSEVLAPVSVTPIPSAWTPTNSFDITWNDPSDNVGLVTGAY